VLVVLLSLLAAWWLDGTSLKGALGVESSPSLHGKVALVTGSTRGIGYHTASRFYAAGAHVIVSGRRQRGSELAAAAIRTDHGTGNATGMSVDLASFKDVQRFATEVARQMPKLDFVVLNAAIAYYDWSPNASFYLTETGYDVVETVNYISNFLLLYLLTDRLNPGATVVLVTDVEMWTASYNPIFPAGGQKVGSRNLWESLPPPWVSSAYGSTKLELMCLEGMAREHFPQHVEDVKVLLVVPGAIKSGLVMSDLTFKHRGDAYSSQLLGWMAPAEIGGKHVFESAFAKLPPGYNVVYGYWFPHFFFKRFAAFDKWHSRHLGPGWFQKLFHLPQFFQRLTLGLHASIGPECPAEVRDPLTRWTAKATGIL